MYCIGYRTEVTIRQLYPGRDQMTYTGAGPFRFETFIRIHSRANLLHLAHGSLAASGWSGATSGEGSQRRLLVSHLLHQEDQEYLLALPTCLAASVVSSSLSKRVTGRAHS